MLLNMFILYDYIHAHDTYIWYLGAVTIEYKRESGGWKQRAHDWSYGSD